MLLPNLPMYWLGVISGIIFLALWQHFVKGRLVALFVLCLHIWALMVQEVTRPLRVIGKAISRKERKIIELDEYEQEIS